MTELFEKCISVILKNEGGYVNDPDDPGGETNFGISKRPFPEVDIKNLTEQQAKNIYYDKYWLPLKLEGLIDENAALQIFDMGVNAGISRAVKIAQYVSKARKDGKMGVATILAINNSACFVERYKTARINFYSSLSGANKYLKGWTLRVINTNLKQNG